MRVMGNKTHESRADPERKPGKAEKLGNGWTL
jgi:hypothetical protein